MHPKLFAKKIPLTEQASCPFQILYLGCGILYKNRETFELVFTNFTEIEEQIIPFFVKYPIAGIKYLDFQDFCKVADIIKEKGHLTIEGRGAILKIKEGMNTGRII